MRTLGIAAVAVAALFGLTGTASATTIGHFHYDWTGQAIDGITASHGDFTVEIDQTGHAIIASAIGSSQQTFGSGGSFTLGATGGNALFFYDFGIGNFDDGSGPGPYDINFNTFGPFDSLGVAGHVRVILWTADTATWLTQDHVGAGAPGQSNSNPDYAYISIVDNNGGQTNTDSGLTYTYTVTSVPEPVSLALVGLGLAGLGWSRRRK